MPNPNYNATLTIYHNGKPNVYEGCFYKCETKVVIADNVASHQNVYTARIPPIEGFEVSLNDVCIKGNVSDVVEDVKGKRLTDIMNRYKPNAFRITAAADNTAFIDPHWRLGG